jgi:hypothetical protein
VLTADNVCGESMIITDEDETGGLDEELDVVILLLCIDEAVFCELMDDKDAVLFDIFVLLELGLIEDDVLYNAVLLILGAEVLELSKDRIVELTGDFELLIIFADELIRSGLNTANINKQKTPKIIRPIRMNNLLVIKDW